MSGREARLSAPKRKGEHSPKEEAALPPGRPVRMHGSLPSPERGACYLCPRTLRTVWASSTMGVTIPKPGCRGFTQTVWVKVVPTRGEAEQGAVPQAPGLVNEVHTARRNTMTPKGSS